jgi:hypothetical protein
MNTSRKVIGAHIRAIRDGAAITSPSAGTASRTLAPDAEEATWVDLGVSDIGIQNIGTTELLMAPSPGARQPFDEITTSKGLKYTAKLKELSNLVMQLLFSSATLPTSPTAGGAFVPLAGQPTVKAWIELKQYDQTDTLINTVYAYVSMKFLGALPFDDKPVDVDVEMTMLYSTLNAGTLA